MCFNRFLWVGIVNILERIVVLELLTCHENVTLSNGMLAGLLVAYQNSRGYSKSM